MQDGRQEEKGWPATSVVCAIFQLGQEASVFGANVVELAPLWLWQTSKQLSFASPTSRVCPSSSGHWQDEGAKCVRLSLSLSL